MDDKQTAYSDSPEHLTEDKQKVESPHSPDSPNEKQTAYADSPEHHIVAYDYIKPQARKLHDPDVTFEEYNYYAQKTREEEKDLEPPGLQWKALLSRKKETSVDGTTNQIDLNLTKEENRMQITDKEWSDASRAFRNASWGAAFYLVRDLCSIELAVSAQADNRLDHD